MIRTIGYGLYSFSEGLLGIACDVLDLILPDGLYRDPAPRPPWTDGTDL